ncbi:MAG: DEAD/DEAH box helicase family protein [Candidatus Xenobiia bacterium LiM19]
MNNNRNPIIYHKLIRDRIPEIVKKEGKEPHIHQADDSEFRAALGDKLFEEAQELYKEWKCGDKEGVLKETADLLEVLRTMLGTCGLDVPTLMTAMEERRGKRGGFDKKLILESVDGKSPDGISQDHPSFLFSHVKGDTIVDLLKSELQRSDRAWIASAFYSPAVINIFLPEFSSFLERGGAIQILLSTMGNITKPDHLIHLKEQLPGLEVKVYHPPGIPAECDPPPFHLKVYLFSRREGKGSVIIGSSNFTASGFTKNIEWNYFTSGEINIPFALKTPFENAVGEFQHYWENEAQEITPAFLEGYRKRFREPAVISGDIFESVPPYGEIKPLEVQIEALRSLRSLREDGATKAAVIAATGTGKTCLAAFDYRQSRCRSLLFIAHRENLLEQARTAFGAIMAKQDFGSIYGGGRELPNERDAVFAMIQTLGRPENLEKFPSDEFEYLVIDEFHHSMADSYRRVIEHFRPSFLLGLTATPERLDGRDVLEQCDYNVACEVRLLDAVDRGWLSPFQYFAVHDDTDYENITWRNTHYDEEELSAVLSRDNRSDKVAENLHRYLPSTGKTRAIAFCSSVAHARYTADRLTTKHGVESISLTGEVSQQERRNAIESLRDAGNPLTVICTVDLFNEGIDIPELSHLLFLRPTQSFTVFLQQLGRGLRKAPNKEYLVVIDLVGNYRKAHVAPLALMGYTSIEEFAEDRKNLHTKTGFAVMPPEGCHISADIEVRRIWDNELRGALEKSSRAEQLKALYQEIRDDLQCTSPSLMDFIASPYDVDPYIFVKQFGNWLRTKRTCEGTLPPDEERLLDTPAEKFLEHLEKELRPAKSYKMVVLKTILGLPGHRWQVSDIASGFLAYYLRHRDHLHDYDDLAKTTDPERCDLKKVERHIRKNPLKYLSNEESDWFILDQQSFSLKDEIVPFWPDRTFRSLVTDRVEFGLHRYFYLRGKTSAASLPSLLSVHDSRYRRNRV